MTNNKKGTSEVKHSAGRPSLVVTTGGRGVMAHVGARLLAELADGLGLTQGIITVATLMPPRWLLSHPLASCTPPACWSGMVDR